MKILSMIRGWAIPAVATAALLLFLISWRENQPFEGGRQERFRDTIPSEKRSDDTGKPAARDFDRELEQLEKARVDLRKAENIDWEKMREDIEAAVRNIDVEKIRLQTEQAIVQIDIEKLQKEIQESIAEIDFDAMQKDIKTAMHELRNIDTLQIRKEMEQARKEMQATLNSEQFRKDLEKAKNIDLIEVKAEMERAKEEMGKAKIELEHAQKTTREEMQKAQIEVEKAGRELRGYQEMVYKMENDGLLNTNEDYTIEYRDGVLSINGTKMENSVTEAFRKYFRDDKKETVIKKRKGQLNVNHN